MDAYQFDSTIKKSQKEISAFKSKAEGVGKKVKSVFNDVSGTATKLVPAIAACTTAIGAFNKILKTSGSLADSFDKISLQIGASIDYMAERAAELNFNNAIEGLKESIKLAGDLAEKLDKIGTLNTFKNLDIATLRRLEAEQKRARVNYDLNSNKETKAALDATTAALKRQQARVNNSYDKIINEEKGVLENYKKTVAKKAGFKDDPLAESIAENLARNEKNLDMSQERYKKFENKKFKTNTKISSSPTNYSYGGKTGFVKLTGLDILKTYDWNKLINSPLLKDFKPFYEATTGQKLTEKGYEKQRRFILVSDIEGLGEDEIDITAITNKAADIEDLEADKISSEYQIKMDEKKARDKTDRNSNKVNTKLTNTNETLEEINKKFEDAKALLSLQLSEGNLDKESYLKELLKTTNNYIDKLYDPLYANLEGVKELRSAAISAKDDITKQLKDLNKPREKFNFGNTNFNLINSDLYRQLEKLITLQLGSSGSMDEAEWSANHRSVYTNALLYDNGTNTDKLIRHIIDINKPISLNYEKVLATIANNDKGGRFLGLSSTEDLSTIFNRAFGGSRAGKSDDKITSDSVYEFLKFVRIISALPSDMVSTFKEEWIKLNNKPELYISKGYDSALPLALKSVPGAYNYIDTEFSPIKEVQDIREKAREKLGVSRKDLNDYYRQGAPILDTKDLAEKIDAFKSFNNLSDLDFFNNSNLESIDKELQTKLNDFKILMKNRLDLKKDLEDELNRGTKIEYDENGKKIGERDLTDAEVNDISSQIEGIDLATKAYKSYIDKLERAQVSTQKLIQISQVFSIKQKEIKEGFDNFRSISNSIGEITGAFSDLDGKVGEFAKTLGALNNFANIIANLVEKLKLLSEAQKAAKIAAEATGVAINGETAATNTNTAITAANSAAKTTSATANNTSATSTTTDTTAKTTNTAATIANTAATTTDTAVSTAKTAANVGEAASEGTKQASKLPFPANIGAIAAVLAAVGGAAATIASLSRKKYATGGIVTGPGSSFSDSIPISVSNGEMILNKSQQKNLFDLLNYGGGSSRGGGSSEVNFKILGENLVGSINNRNKGRNKIL